MSIPLANLFSLVLFIVQSPIRAPGQSSSLVKMKLKLWKFSSFDYIYIFYTKHFLFLSKNFDWTVALLHQINDQKHFKIQNREGEYKKESDWKRMTLGAWMDIRGVG